MRPTLKSTGLKSAEAKVRALVQGVDHSRGCYYEGATRHDDIGRGRMNSNGEVIDNLAKGERDIRPTEEDGDKAARAMVMVAERRLRAVRVAMTQAQATMLFDAAWRAAGESVMREMWMRVKSETTNDGNPARKVSKKYADWRFRHYQVQRSRVFKMSGQLLSNLNPTHSNVARIKMVHR